MRPYYFDLDRVRLARRRWNAVPGDRLRERRELATLDHRMRRDIGVTPSDIASECNKPFWRA